MERLGYFDGIVPSLACILTKQYGVRGGKYPLKTPGNSISETLNFTMSLDASALKNLCLWCEFQSHLLFIISLLLKKLFDSPDSGAKKCIYSKCFIYFASNLSKTDYRGRRVLGGYGKRVNLRTSVSLPPVLFLTTEKRYEQVDNDRFCYSLSCTCSIC